MPSIAIVLDSSELDLVIEALDSAIDAGVLDGSIRQYVKGGSLDPRSSSFDSVRRALESYGDILMDEVGELNLDDDAMVAFLESGTDRARKFNNGAAMMTMADDLQTLRNRIARKSA